MAWLNKLRAAALSCRIKTVIGGRVIQTTDGVSIEISPASAGGGGGIKMYQLMSEADDWSVCRLLAIDKDGARTVGATDVYIAKPAELRHSIVEEIIDGDDVTYAYTNEHERVATLDGSDETQVVVPWYLPHDGDNDGSIIYAHETTGTGVWREIETDVFQELTLLEISGREWAEQ